MNDTERQLILDLMAKAQVVIESIPIAEMNYGVDKETRYTVNAHTIWELSTALGVIERDLGISVAEEPELDSVELKLLKVIENGSAKSFIYEESDRT